MSVLFRAQIALFFMCLAFAASFQQECGETVCCPRSWLGFNGHCYRYFTYRKTWSEAQSFCSDIGADLVSIHSAHENAILNTLVSGEEVWIGMSDTDVEGSFQWSDGTPSDFTAWDTAQPNDYAGGEDCAELNYPTKPDGTWNNYGCTNRKGFICKK